MASTTIGGAIGGCYLVFCGSPDAPLAGTLAVAVLLAFAAGALTSWVLHTR
jgi:hypothetical protein